MKDFRFNGLTMRDEYALDLRCRGADNSRAQRILRSRLPKVIENELTDKQRETLAMFYFQGMKADEIAAALGVNRSTVYRSLQRARRRIRHSLRWALEPEEEEEN